MKKIILITGGQRSGKSTKAEELALSLSDNPVYVATAKVWDDEFRERVRRHQERRGPQWANIEEEIFLSRHDLTSRVVVIDCVTLWLTNFFFANDSNVDKSLELAKEEFETEKYRKLIADLGVSGEYAGIGHCAVGYADCKPPAPALRKDGRVFYI